MLHSTIFAQHRLLKQKRNNRRFSSSVHFFFLLDDLKPFLGMELIAGPSCIQILSNVAQPTDNTIV